MVEKPDTYRENRVSSSTIELRIFAYIRIKKRARMSDPSMVGWND